jgi:hypothetical protein
MRMQVFGGPLDDDVSVGSAVTVGVDLFGEGGADTLTGGQGDDFIEPGAGLDVPKGGPGRDRLSFDDGRTGPVAFNLGPGGTTVDGGEDDAGSRTSPVRRSTTRSSAMPGPTTSMASAGPTVWTASSGTTCSTAARATTISQAMMTTTS